MIVCRTLDYIKNMELHKFLGLKFTNAKNIGIDIEIELTESIDDIIIELGDLIEILDVILEESFVLMQELHYKKLIFCAFYKDDDLWFIIKHSVTTDLRPKDISKKIFKILNKHRNIVSSVTNKDSWITHELILLK